MAEALKVRNGEEREAGGEGAAGIVEKATGPVRRFREFLHEVRVEMKNVTWPTPSDVRGTTIVVIITVLFFALYLFVVDRGVSQLVQRVLQGFKP